MGGGMIFVLILVFLIIVAPTWILFNYLGRTKVAQGISKEDEKILEDLWRIGNKLEERMKSLEIILGEDDKKERRT